MGYLKWCRFQGRFPQVKHQKEETSRKNQEPHTHQGPGKNERRETRRAPDRDAKQEEKSDREGSCRPGHTEKYFSPNGVLDVARFIFATCIVPVPTARVGVADVSVNVHPLTLSSRCLGPRRHSDSQQQQLSTWMKLALACT